MKEFSEADLNSSKRRLEHGWYAVSELAEFALPSFPGTVQGWHKVVAREKWAYKEVRAKGGKAGIKRLYKPPPAVQALIDGPRPEVVSLPPRPSAVAAEAGSASYFAVDWTLLEALLRVAEHKLKEPLTSDVADKIDRLVLAWSPVAGGRPDLEARLERVSTAVALLRLSSGL